MTDSKDLAARRAFAQLLAREAGAMALDYFNRRAELTIESKADAQDVVSIADREVERLIRRRVAAAFPGDGVLGEEYGLDEGSSGALWVVDPIDGTSPFVNGMPNWCVSIGLAQGGAPSVGAIFAPLLDEDYGAARGLGATLNGRPIRVLGPERDLTNAVVGLGANRRVSPADAGKRVADLQEMGGSFMRIGSGALTIAWVAAGRLVGYFEQVMNSWDCWAGHCLVAEAGGFVLPFPGDSAGILQPAPVLVAAPGAEAQMRRWTGR